MTLQRDDIVEHLGSFVLISLAAAQVGAQTVLVPFDGSTGLSAASFPGATTIDISIQQPLCGTVSLASFGYIITSSTVSLPNAVLGDVSSRTTSSRRGRAPCKPRNRHELAVLTVGWHRSLTALPILCGLPHWCQRPASANLRILEQ